MGAESSTELLSKPVLAGYLTGTAVLMVAGELDAVTGTPVTGDGVLARVDAAYAQWYETRHGRSPGGPAPK